MTKFENIGVERQFESETAAEANQNFRHSCDVCCTRGMKIECVKCAIAHVHNEIITCFDVYKTVKC